MNKYTLDELYQKTFDTYLMIFDNKGNFKYGKGICPFKVIKASEKIIKGHIRKNRKHDLKASVLWNKAKSDVSKIQIIR